MKQEHIAVAGAGLVGSLMACLLSKEGYKVTVFERRADPRASNMLGGRSINLALSDRGWKALEMAGMREKVEETIIPMEGRMMHSPEGKLTFQPYGKEGQAINSVPRGGLNELLLKEADANDRVNFLFEHKCLGADFDKGILTVQDASGKAQDYQFDAIIGADGAFSAVRGAMQKTDRFNFSQQYIPHGYKELNIPPTADGGFQLDPAALHIWPRRQFMLIALPNKDGSFTCTLFLAFEGSTSFSSLSTPEAVESFFEEHFADTMPLINNLTEQFFANPTSSLITVRCEPWNKGKAILLGDAAHAIVPFYGQGMNAGFEDCSLLMETLKEQNGNWNDTLLAFSSLHSKNGHAIADLALKNFIEMRDLVADEQFLLQKKIEAKLHECLGNDWMPLYSMVTFSHTPYSEAIAMGKQQDEIMKEVLRMERVKDWEDSSVFNEILSIVEQRLSISPSTK